MNFIVRASIDGKGLLHGVVVEPQSGRKEQFSGPEQLATVVNAMAGPDDHPDTGLARLDRSEP
jgi:hypothetical protein